MPITAKRTYQFLGDVSNDNAKKLFDWLRERADEDPEGQVSLIITSAGGSTQLALAFVDYTTIFKKMRMETTALGETSSAAIPLFMCGERRIVTPSTSFLLHEISRTFDSSRRWTPTELRTILEFMENGDKMYSEFIAGRSGGRTTPAEIRDLMRRQTYVSATHALQLGLAHEIAS